jgi:hypothetical protein|tara:strand:+ start:205 stop:378 length:174 start_codon:yes stop_codon:yes gene_type:complete
LDTRIVPGENVMLSVVRVGPNKSGEVHSHPREQWGVVLDIFSPPRDEYRQAGSGFGD